MFSPKKTYKRSPYIDIGNNPEIKKAFLAMRNGYPEKPWNKQCHGLKFRQKANIVISKLVEKTLPLIYNKTKTVVIIPWRSGLAFGEAYRLAGIKNFYHISSKRNEKTLETEVDYESGRLNSGSLVIITDPMLATGNTMADAIIRIKKKNIAEENIIINSVIAAPSGVAKIKKMFPDITIIVGAMDKKLDKKGYIVPGLGDFGDKYFADMNIKDIEKFLKDFKLDKTTKNKLAARIKKQAV